jgi:hypothetical protein
MNKTDLILAIKGKPSPFATPSGTVVDLRPITLPERLAIFAWHNEQETEQKSFYAHRLKLRYVSLGLCNKDGDQLFTDESEVESLPLPAVDFDAIAAEVARRAGLLAEESEAGKELPATPS